MSDRWRVRFPKNSDIKDNECAVIFSYLRKDGKRIEVQRKMKIGDAEAALDIIMESSNE